MLDKIITILAAFGYNLNDFDIMLFDRIVITDTNYNELKAIAEKLFSYAINSEVFIFDFDDVKTYALTFNDNFKGVFQVYLGESKYAKKHVYYSFID